MSTSGHPPSTSEYIWIFHDDICLSLVSKRDSACDHLLVRYGGLVHADVHVPVGRVHRHGREGIAQRVRKPLEESLFHGSDCHRSHGLVGKICWDDVKLAKILAPDQQVVSEIAADHGVDAAHEVVGTNIYCCCALDRHRRPGGVYEGGTFESVNGNVVLLRDPVC